MRPGTEVKVTDLETGESFVKVLFNDFLVITDGNRFVDGVTGHGNGTVVYTIKVRPIVKVTEDLGERREDAAMPAVPPDAGADDIARPSTEGHNLGPGYWDCPAKHLFEGSHVPCERGAGHTGDHRYLPPDPEPFVFWSSTEKRDDFAPPRQSPHWSADSVVTYKYDPEADSLYIKVGSPAITHTSSSLRRCLLDLAADGSLVGIDVPNPNAGWSGMCEHICFERGMELGESGKQLIRRLAAIRTWSPKTVARFEPVHAIVRDVRCVPGTAQATWVCLDSKSDSQQHPSGRVVIIPEENWKP